MDSALAARIVLIPFTVEDTWEKTGDFARKNLYIVNV